MQDQFGSSVWPLEQGPRAAGLSHRKEAEAAVITYAEAAFITYVPGKGISSVAIGQEGPDTYSLAARFALIFGSCSAFWIGFGLLIT